MRRAAVVVSGLVVALTWPAPASAHTDLVSTTPRDGVTVASWPDEVAMTFSEAVEPRLSSVSISIDDRPARRAPITSATETAQLVVDLGSMEPAASAGAGPRTVRVSYRVTSADGHPISGSWNFRAPLPAEAPSASTTPEPVERVDEPAGTSAAVAQDDGATAGAWVLAALVAAVVLSVLVSAGRARRRSTRPGQGGPR